MLRVLIGTLVGAIIFFGFQAAMWMGGFHDDVFKYTAKQDSIVQYLSNNGLEDGVYAMPLPDPKAAKTHKEMEESMKSHVGKPWAMVFYHSSMKGEDPGMLMRGAMHALLAALLVSLVLYNGRFATFGSRFLVSMAFAAFALCLCTFSDMNWWQYPWSYSKAAVMDLAMGWGIASLWLAFYVRRKVTGA
jgi:hypothetical protein